MSISMLNTMSVISSIPNYMIMQRYSATRLDLKGLPTLVVKQNKMAYIRRKIKLC